MSWSTVRSIEINYRREPIKTIQNDVEINNALRRTMCFRTKWTQISPHECGTVVESRFDIIKGNFLGVMHAITWARLRLIKYRNETAINIDEYPSSSWAPILEVNQRRHRPTEASLYPNVPNQVHWTHFIKKCMSLACEPSAKVHANNGFSISFLLITKYKS